MEQKLEEKKEKKNLFGNVKFFQKLKSIKHIEIIIAVVLGAVVLLIYLSTFGSGGKKTSSSFQATGATEYASMLETKLENIIKQINGVGNVSVMVTLESGPEYVYATDEEQKTNTSEEKGTIITSTTETKTPITISNEMVVVKEIMPTVGGIVVVAGGADNTKVKLEIVKAIQALVNVPQSSIEVLVGK